jgi:hypothetical protein
MIYNALVSSGGAGTHFLNHAAQGLLHPQGWMTHRKIGVKQPVPFRVVYLYSDPFNQILSFYRRGFFNDHHHIKSIGGDFKSISVNNNWTFDTYLKNGIDYFKIEDHFDTWRNISTNHEKIFIKYEHLPKTVDELSKACELPDWFATTVKNDFKQRQSKWTELDEQLQSYLYNMFGDFKKRLEEYPSLMIC